MNDIDRSRVDIYELTDGCSFAIAPGWGCNLFSWVAGGDELMYCPDDYPAAAPKITGGGNPLLFPSVGRTWDHSSGEPVQGRYRIYGDEKTYTMPSHGVLLFCDFKKADEQRSGDSLSVLYETAVPDHIQQENYPFNVGFAQRYTLKPASVELETIITNKGDKPVPCAFGHHPYFRVSNVEREGVEVRLQAARHLLLTKDTVLFTGDSEDTNGIIPLQAGIYYDNAFDSPTGRRMSLIDRKAGHTIHVDYDDQFELFFVYSPDNAKFVCIEPWTRGLGAYEMLRNPGWESGEHIPVLKPGERRVLRAEFRIEKSVPE